MAAVFLVKAVVLAFMVTPLWDVPDETGHYGLIADLADGRGLAVSGNVLPPDVVTDWGKGGSLSADERVNWVAHHPPLYHLLGVPFLQVARALGAPPHLRFRAPRLLSALAGSATLLVLFLVCWEVSLDPVFAFAAASSVGFLPMFTHMSSGTNHDVLVALLVSAAALFWVRLSRSGQFSDAMKMGVALALAGTTKLSALVVTAALLSTCWSWLRSRGARRLFEWLSIVCISFSLPGLWTLRQLLIFGHARFRPGSGKPFEAGNFLAYLHENPVVDHTFKNFVGLIGWTGSGAGRVRWFQISGAFLAVYLVIALTVTAAAAVWFWRRNHDRVRWIFGVAATGLFLSCVLWLFPATHLPALPKYLLYGLLAATPLLALPRLFAIDASPEEKVIAASQAVFLLFSGAYLVNGWEAYQIYGHMRATHGRYFFAVLPFLLLAFMLPAVRVWRPTRNRDALFLGLLAVLFSAETAFYLFRVLPFYRGGLR